MEKLTTGRTASLLSPELDDPTDWRPVFDWTAVINLGSIVYVGLDALSDYEVAAAVGESMFADLSSVAGSLYKFGAGRGLPGEVAPRRIAIHADEFNELIDDEFIPLLNKAGGAGFKVMAYTQIWSDDSHRLPIEPLVGPGRRYSRRRGRRWFEFPIRRAALLFHWGELERQVRVEGVVGKASDDESDAHFVVRPLGSRIGAWAWPQSEVLPDRATLEQRYAEMAVSLGDQPLRPPTWGGYRLAPAAFAFWQGRSSRLHDRVRYLRAPHGGSAGRIVRLAP